MDFITVSVVIGRYIFFMVGNLWWDFHFTNRHIIKITDDLLNYKKITGGLQVKLVLCE